MWVKGKVTDKFNIYKFIVEKFGKEKEEKTVSSFEGALSIRRWDKNITLVRRVYWDGEKWVMEDEVNLPDDLGKELLKLAESKGCKIQKEDENIFRVEC